MREEINRRVVNSDQMKDYEMVDQTMICMSEFDDGTFDVEVLRFSEIIESATLKNKDTALESYRIKQNKYFGKVIDNGNETTDI